MVGRVGALISMHQMNLSSYVVPRKMHRDRASPASLLLASVAASPPCRLVLVYQWRYSRCIEIGSHLHRHWWHQRRLRRLSSRYWLARGLWQMHRDRVSPASPLVASAAASPPVVPGTGWPVDYGRCIEIGSHLHRHWWHQRRLRRLSSQVLVGQWRYGRCIEIGSHLHRHWWHQRRLRRLSSQVPGWPMAL